MSASLSLIDVQLLKVKLLHKIRMDCNFGRFNLFKFCTCILLSYMCVITDFVVFLLQCRALKCGFFKHQLSAFLLNSAGGRQVVAAGFHK